MNYQSVCPVRFKKLYPEAIVPYYHSEQAAGMDLHYLGEPVTIPKGERAILGTGIAMELLPAFEGQVRSRSGLAAKKGAHVLNSPGTIDPDYRGEVMVILQNSGPLALNIRNGDRIAQLVICPFFRANIEVVEELSSTERGEQGLGSTGVSQSSER